MGYFPAVVVGGASDLRAQSVRWAISVLLGAWEPVYWAAVFGSLPRLRLVEQIEQLIVREFGYG